VKAVETSADEAAFCSIGVKPNFAVLKERAAPKLKDIGKALAGFGFPEVSRLEAGETIDVVGERIGLSDVLLARTPVSGKAVANMTDWKNLDMNYQVIAHIDQASCIGCGRCHVACEDTAHQAVAQLIDAAGTRRYEIIEQECVGCNLCEITCPVQGCITMTPQDTGKPYMNWSADPRNPKATAG